MTDTLNPVQNYLLLETDGTAVPLPGGEVFWKQLMSGHPTDAGIQRLASATHGRLLAALPMDKTWTNWKCTLPATRFCSYSESYHISLGRRRKSVARCPFTERA